MLLLAGLIFAGGTLAVFMGPRNDTPSTNDVAGFPGPTFSRLEIFQQQTPTPTPTPVLTPGITPWFPSASPSFGSFSPVPSFGVTSPPLTPTPTSVTDTPPPNSTPRPTPPPNSTPRPTPKPTPTPAPRAKFSASQQGNSTTVAIDNNTVGRATSWFWDFGDGQTSNDKNPGSHNYGAFGTYTITLTAEGPGGRDTFQKQVSVQDAPPTPPPTDPPPTDPPTPTPDPGGSPAAPAP